MRGVEFPQQTIVFGKPEGWKDEDCYGLPIAQTYYENSDGSRVPCLISRWENGDQIVYLSITGTGMPPVSLSTVSPFPEEYDKEAALAVHKELAAIKVQRSFDDLIPGLVPAIYQAIGGASACWENISGAGTFRSQDAAQIADNLIAFIKKNIQP